MSQPAANICLVRSTVKAGKSLPDQITEADIQDDKFLMPVLADDALIMCLDDLPPSSAVANGKGKAVEDASTTETAGDAASKNASLQVQLDELNKQFANYRLAVEQTLDKRWHADDDDSSSRSSAESKKEKKDESQYYWESYAHNGTLLMTLTEWLGPSPDKMTDIHETMLKDTIRTEGYRDFIYNNKHLFKGKTVLDIGCGTGILSMFCAKAGAAHVYAIDKSAILDKARENIFNNGLSDQITCLRGRVEDIVLPVDKVDIIVSEWMGYALLYEAMLPSVLFARDRYLKPDGLLVPSHTTIFFAPVSDPEYVTDNVTFWRDVYGFDMKAMQEGMLKEVRVQTMPTEALCGSASTYALDLYHVKVEDLTFKINWSSKLSKDIDNVDGFLIWFDNYFATTRQKEVELIETPADDWEKARKDGSNAFTTGPHRKETHWKQVLMLIEDKDGQQRKPLKAGEQIEGTLSYSAPEDHARGLLIKIEWDGLPNPEKSQVWALN